MRRLLAAAVAGIASAAFALQPTSASAAQAERIAVPLHTAVAELPVAVENRTGYDRSLFPHWVDADGDRCNSRQEVLIAEAFRPPEVDADCRLTGGEWYSYYDDAYWTVPTDLDIDHMVPLAEAWDSGARDWDTARRRAYANDLGDDRPLVAVTDNVNQAKADRDPAEWQPVQEKCRYAQEWVAVKLRWRLTVDEAEKAALTDLAGGCPNAPIVVQAAP